jgi:hypothetical protein
MSGTFMAFLAPRFSLFLPFRRFFRLFLRLSYFFAPGEAAILGVFGRFYGL